MTVCLFACAATTPHSPLCLDLHYTEKGQLSPTGLLWSDLKEESRGVLTIIQPSRSKFDPFTLKYLAASIHCALGNPL